MASKYELISALSESTAQDLSRDPAAWMHFLDTAGRMYRYPFMDQLLIHAQRPDATACAELEVWNEKMNCWVNKGSKGIALLTERNGRSRLRYVFDVSNVHPAYICKVHSIVSLKNKKSTLKSKNGTFCIEYSFELDNNPCTW